VARVLAHKRQRLVQQDDPLKGVSFNAMTLAMVCKGPEGIVLAADSRITLTTTLPDAKESFVAYFDNATKLFGIDKYANVGILTHGNNIIGSTNPRGIHGFMGEFEALVGKNANAGTRNQPKTPNRSQNKIADIATRLGKFYKEKWDEGSMPENAAPVGFLIAGFDADDPYGKIYEISVPDSVEPIEYLPGASFGVRWNGQSELVTRLINGFDPRALEITKDEHNLTDQQIAKLREKWSNQLSLSIPWQFLPLQDCVDLASFLVSLTSVTQAWTTRGIRGVGGPTDVATITRNHGFQPIRQKQITVRSWH
jgi:hypothetical protein